MDLKTNFKTPVSILLEVGTKLETQAIFLEHFDDSRSECKGRFKSKVIFQDYTAYGSGGTKKEAKQDCAKAMVSLLRETNEEFKGVIEKICLKHGTIPQSALLEDNKAPTNSVMDLLELCISKSFPLPKFQLLSEQGPPHAKVFTMSCTLANFKHEASATTKKQCKQIVASMMLRTLNAPTTSESPDKEDEDSSVFDDFAQFEINISDQYDDPTFNFESEALDELLETYENVDDLRAELETKNAYNLLLRILEESTITHKINTYESKKGRVVVGIEVNISRSARYLSIGESYEKSLQSSSIKAICSFFLIKTKVCPEADWILSEI